MMDVRSLHVATIVSHASFFCVHINQVLQVESCRCETDSSLSSGEESSELHCPHPGLNGSCRCTNEGRSL